ncbi:hypothetical protein ABPG77_006943 [Micractinium sp. CCAP 211/92]
MSPASLTGATPRTPHSPKASPIGSRVPASPTSMAAAARPGTASDAVASIRPVTARTWQALSAPPAADEKARMSVYTNDLYSNAGAAPLAARPLSPLYQPTSGRPATPSATPAPRSAERLQHQRIASPSRLQGEGGSPRGMQRLQLPVPGLSAANVPTAALVPAGPAQLQAETEARPGTAPAAQLRTSSISLASLKQPAPAAVIGTHREGLQQQQQQQQQQLSQEQAGEGAEGATSSLSPRSAFPAGGSITRDSPRMRQQVLRNFAGAVPASGGSGGSSPLGNTPRPALLGERANGGSGGGDRRPATPSFQPVALPRPATALGGPAVTAGSGFSIKTGGVDPAGSGPLGQLPGGEAAPRALSAYPQPPQTAPSKAALPAAPAAPAAPPPGSLASFGISAAAFVAAPDKAAGGGAAQAEGEGEREGGSATAALLATTQAAMLASSSFATRADLRRFLLTPGPADRPLNCKILRSGGGLLKGGPQYTLLVEQEGGRNGAFLLAARKRKGGPGGAAYVLSVDQHDVSRHNASYVGKLRSNFIGTEFVVYDAGSTKGEGAPPRCELGAVLYQPNVLGTKGPRKMTVLIPKLASSGSRPGARAPGSEGETLLGQYKSYSLSSCVVLRNKPPRWNQAMSAYCLNFGGRVTQASVKNFQLVSVDNMDRTILQFGKVASDAFTMDYCYPMTALQAFAICLSSFDSKLACE